MLSKGYNTDYLLLMHRIAGFKTNAKGVVCPFLTPRDPVAR